MPKKKEPTPFRQATRTKDAGRGAGKVEPIPDTSNLPIAPRADEEIEVSSRIEMRLGITIWDKNFSKSSPKDRPPTLYVLFAQNRCVVLAEGYCKTRFQATPAVVLKAIKACGGYGRDYLQTSGPGVEDTERAVKFREKSKRGAARKMVKVYKGDGAA